MDASRQETPIGMVGFGFASAGVLVWIGWIQAHSAPPLLACGTKSRLFSSFSNTLQPLRTEYARAAWLPNGKLLYERFAGPQDIVICFDPATKIETSLTALNRPAANLLRGPFALSPDGKWLLSSSDIWHGCSALALDGTQIISRKLWHADYPDYIDYASNPLWMPDSRHWVILAWGGRGLEAVVEGLDRPDVLKRIPLGYPRGTVYWDTVGARLLGFTRSGRLLAEATVGGAGENATMRKMLFFSLNVGDGPADLKQYSFSLPITGIAEIDWYEALDKCEAVTMSPQGDRLAWLTLAQVQPPFFVSFLSAWFPALRKFSHSSQMVIRLCCSRLDGSRMRVIGSMPLAAGTTYEKLDQLHLPYDLCWLPDGRHLSFIYKDALYTVPAD